MPRRKSILAAEEMATIAQRLERAASPLPQSKLDGQQNGTMPSKIVRMFKMRIH